MLLFLGVGLALLIPVRLLAQVPSDSRAELGLTEPPPYQVGQTLDLIGRFVSGPADAFDAVLTVTATSGITFLSVTAIHPTQPLSCNLNSPQEVVCTRDVVRGSTEIFISMRFDAPGDHTLIATASQSNPDPNPDNNTVGGIITVEGDPPASGAISGIKWHDQNENGEQDAGEPGLAGWTIYVDENGNGQLDGGEPSATTGAGGAYQIDDLEPDTYTVREVLQEGWQQTFPAGEAHTVTVNAGETTGGVDFGNYETVQTADLGLLLTATPTSLSKVAEDDTLGASVGDTLDVEVEVDNSGPDAADNVTISIVLDDAGNVFVIDPESIDTCDGQGTPSMPNADTIRWDVNQVDDGETFRCGFRVSTVERGQATIDGTVTATTDDPDPSNNTYGLYTVVTEQLADLAVEKIVQPDSVFVGDTLTYTVSVLNAGPDEATNVFFNDMVAIDSLEFVAATLPAGCLNSQNLANEVLDCFIGTIPVGETASVKYQARAKLAGTVTNLVTNLSADQPDPDPTNNTGVVQTVVRSGADLSVEKIASIDFSTTADTVAVGAVITYTVIVTNNGPETAFLVETDDLVFADSLAFVAATVPENCDLGTATDDDTALPLSTMTCRLAAILDVGASQSVTYQAVAKTKGTVSNEVEVKGDPRDLNPSNNIAIATTVVESGAADLAVEKFVLQNTAFVGDTLTYTVFVINAGPDEATNVFFNDVVAFDSLEFSAVTEACTLRQNNSQLDCSIGRIPVGENASVKYQARTKLAGTVTNLVTNLSADQPDPDPTNNTGVAKTVVRGGADLSVEKTAVAGGGLADTVDVGTEITYTVLVTNNGPETAFLVEIDDLVFADSLEFVAATVPENCDLDTALSTMTCRLAAILDPGESVSVTYDAIAKTKGTVSNKVEVRGQIEVRGEPFEFDPNPSNNIAQTSTVVNAKTTIDFTLDATASTATARAGDDVTFSFSLSSDGVTESGTITITASDAWTDPRPGDSFVVVDGDTMAVAAKDSVAVEVDPEGFPEGTTRLTYFFPDGFPDGRRYDGSLRLGVVQSNTSAAKSQARASVRFEAFVPGNEDPNPADDVVEVFVDIEDTGTAVEPDAGDEIPAAFRLHTNYPNPFNPETTIRFDIKEQAPVRLQVFNLLGQAVETLVDEVLAPGTYRAVFDARGLPSGSYFYRLEAGAFSQTRPMVLLK